VLLPFQWAGQEAGIPFPQQTFEAFQELHEIVGDMRHDKLDAALQYVLSFAIFMAEEPQMDPTQQALPPHDRLAT
jgi:hypothetical protein